MKRIRLTFLIIVFLAFSSYLVFSRTHVPYLTVMGNVKMCDGIGRQSAELIRSLHKEIDLAFYPTMATDFKDVPNEIIPILKKANKHLGKVIIYESSLPEPNQKFFKKLKKRLRGPKNKKQVRIAYSMTETDQIPELWAEGLNTYFDAVAVPDSFLVEVYKKSGVKIPIFVLPLSIELDDFLSVPLKESAHSPFCFMNLGSMISRKNHIGLIKAFHLAFGEDPTVQLVMNYRYAKGETLQEVRKLIAELNVKNIILTNSALDRASYLETFKRADCLVTLSKGEGFSIQPREAMALGLPIIISDNTAHKTILDSCLACGVACPTSLPYYDPFKKRYCGSESIPDIEEAAKRMREVRTHFQDELKKASRRREWVKQYCFNSLKLKYLSLIKPKKVILGDRDALEDDGLITPSVELVEKYKTLFEKI